METENLLQKWWNNKRWNTDNFVKPTTEPIYYHIHGTERNSSGNSLSHFSVPHIHDSYLHAHIVTFFASPSQLTPTWCPFVTNDLIRNGPISYPLTTDYVCWLTVVSGMCALHMFIKNTKFDFTILHMSIKNIKFNFTIRKFLFLFTFSN